MSALETDAEALLPEHEVSVQGSFRPLRTLALAGSVLGLASVVVPRWTGSETSAMPEAPIHGLVELAADETHHIAVYIDADTNPTECLQHYDDEVEIKPCDPDEADQKFKLDEFYIKFGDRCLEEHWEFVKCKEKEDRQWTTWTTGVFGNTDKRGPIKQCACAGPDNCPADCKDAESWVVSGGKLSLSATDETAFTFLLDHKEPEETHHIAVYIDKDTNPKKCLQHKEEEAVIKDCDPDEADQKFEIDGAYIKFGTKCLNTDFEFVKCKDKASRHWTTWRNGDNGMIRACNCQSADNCEEDCSTAEAMLVTNNHLELSDAGKAGTAFTFKLDHKDIDPDPDYPCTRNGENCLKSQCCSEAGMTCFGKNEEWASCNATCSNNAQWNFDKEKWEDVGHKVWSCSVVGAKPTCGKNGDNCIKSKCCEDQSSTCFKKNDEWASCNATCDSHMKWIHDDHKWEKQDEKVWDCSALSCTKNGDNCASSKCCSEPGMTCFKKNDHWSSCNATCSHNQMWVDGKWDDQGKHIWDCDKLS